MGKIVVSRVLNGPIRAVLEMEEEKLNQFRPRERNALLARCLERAMKLWRGLFVKVRFSKSVLGDPFDYKLDSKTPLMDSGTMARVIYGGQVIARSPGGNVKGTVTLPLGHPVRKEIARVLKVVPAPEVQFVADRFAEFVATGLKESDVIPNRRPEIQPRRRLTVKQRRAFGIRRRKGT